MSSSTQPKKQLNAKGKHQHRGKHMKHLKNFVNEVINKGEIEANSNPFQRYRMSGHWNIFTTQNYSEVIETTMVKDLKNCR